MLEDDAGLLARPITAVTVVDVSVISCTSSQGPISHGVRKHGPVTPVGGVLWARTTEHRKPTSFLVGKDCASLQRDTLSSRPCILQISLKRQNRGSRYLSSTTRAETREAHGEPSPTSYVDRSVPDE